MRVLVQPVDKVIFQFNLHNTKTTVIDDNLHDNKRAI